MKDLIRRLKGERLTEAPIEQPLHLCHGCWIDSREVRALWEVVSDQTIGALIHPAFPRMIGRGKEDGGVQALLGVPVSGKLFTVVVGNGVDMLA